MIFVENPRGGREVNVINTGSKINLSKVGWEGGGPTSIWIMSFDILFFYVTAKDPVHIFKSDYCVETLKQTFLSSKGGHRYLRG